MLRHGYNGSGSDSLVMMAHIKTNSRNCRYQLSTRTASAQAAGSAHCHADLRATTPNGPPNPAATAATEGA